MDSNVETTNPDFTAWLRWGKVILLKGQSAHNESMFDYFAKRQDCKLHFLAMVGVMINLRLNTTITNQR